MPKMAKIYINQVPHFFRKYFVSDYFTHLISPRHLILNNYLSQFYCGEEMLWYQYRTTMLRYQWPHVPRLTSSTQLNWEGVERVKKNVF